MTTRFVRPAQLALAVLAVAFAPCVFAQAAPNLGTAGNFAVLGGSTVTNTGPSIITGELGVSPGTAVTGFPPGLVVGGTIHSADAAALSAQNALTVAYNSAAAAACNTVLTGSDLGGLTLTPGVYCFASSAQLTGTLTLNAQGNPAAVFIFQTGTTLTTASASQVVVINGGSACNAYWQVGSSATLGTGTNFAGNILANASITLNTGSAVAGRTLARTGAVTLDTANVTVCAGGTFPPLPPGGGVLPQGPQPVPMDSPLALAILAMLLGAAGLFFGARQMRAVRTR